MSISCHSARQRPFRFPHRKRLSKATCFRQPTVRLNAGCGICLRSQIHIRFVRQHTPVETHGRIVNKYWLIQPEYRYWTCRKFNGSFWGAYLNGAQFNVGGKKMPFGLFPWLKEHRYAGWLAGGGISYGYHIMLNRHWNIEVSVGVGYEYIDYKKYKCPDVCAELLEKGHYHYFGPSRASLSIVYIFN